MSFDPGPAASLLAKTWRDSGQIKELPEAMRPRTLAEGYDAQEALVAEMGGVAGWKLGLGSAAGMRGGGLDRPLAGRVLRAYMHAKGDTVRLPNAAPATVEFEIAFVFGQDIAPADRLADPLKAVAEMRVTFELVMSRFVNRRAAGWPSFVADSVGFGALVVGDPITDIEAVASAVVIDVDGEEVARGLTGDEATYPVTAFNYLIEHARDRGATLRRGEIATLGAVGKPFDLARNGRVTARYPGGALDFRLEAAGS